MTGPKPIVLDAPWRIDMHAKGMATFHYRASVVGRQRVDIAVPQLNAHKSFESLVVSDSRGPSPLITLPFLPADYLFTNVVPYWLRQHIGRRVELQSLRHPRGPPPSDSDRGNRNNNNNNSDGKSGGGERAAWTLRGTLLGFRKRSDFGSDEDGGDNGSHTLFMRVDDADKPPPPPPPRRRGNNNRNRGNNCHSGGDGDDDDENDDDEESEPVGGAGRGAIVARSIGNFADLVVRTVEPDTAVAEVPGATGARGTLYISIAPARGAVGTDQAGELRVSYTHSQADTLFDLRYEVDATAVTVRGGAAHARAPVTCTASVHNPFPFALRGTELWIVDAASSGSGGYGGSGGAELELSSEVPDTYGRKDVTSTTWNRPANDFNSLRSSYMELLQSSDGSNAVQQRVETYTNRTMDLSETTENARSRHTTFRICLGTSVSLRREQKVRLEIPLGLQPEEDADVRSDASRGCRAAGGGESGVANGSRTNCRGSERNKTSSSSSHSTSSCSSSPSASSSASASASASPGVVVGVSFFHLTADHCGEVEPVVRVWNLSQHVLQAGMWAVRHGPLGRAERAMGPVVPGQRFRVALGRPKTIDMDRDFVGKCRGERVVGMRGTKLLTQLEQERGVHVALHNKSGEAASVLFATEYQTEEHLRGTERVRLFHQAHGHHKKRRGAARRRGRRRGRGSGSGGARDRGEGSNGSASVGDEERHGDDGGREEEQEQEDDSGSGSDEDEEDAEWGGGGGGVGGVELEATVDEPRGYLTYTFRLAGHSRCVLVARQTYRSDAEYDVRKGAPPRLCRRLAAGGASDALVGRLDAALEARAQVEDAGTRLKAYQEQFAYAQSRIAAVALDLSDNEDGEAIDRYEAEVARLESCVARLRRCVRRAEERAVDAQTAFSEAIELLRVAAQPELGLLQAPS